MKYKKTRILQVLTYQLMLGLSLFSFVQCTPLRAEKAPVAQTKVEIEEVVVPEESPITYQLVASKDTSKWLSALKPGDTLTALSVINRIDPWRLKHLDTLIFPDTIGTEIGMYAPFPNHVEAFQNIHKILFVSHYAQAFAVYENGERIKWGPVSLGRKYNPTPIGLFATNWKSKKTTSTVNSSWILEWYFNLDNYEGIGMHQYALPGYPASHGCVRLYRDDANWLYNWADQWIVENSKISVHGTPVVIFEEYPYGQKRPWLLLAEDVKAMEITAENLESVVDGYLPTILKRQFKRNSVNLYKMISSR
jgi:lipoprotein-anchoring transpeptidase ErfK/SrfK